MSTDADDQADDRAAAQDAERRAAEQEHRLAERLGLAFSEAWTQLRTERRAQLSEDPVPPIRSGSSNFARAQVPYGVDLAAAWSWRILVIAAATAVIGWLLAYFSVITLPLVVALLIAALSNPLVRLGGRIGLPRAASAGLVVLGGLALVGGLLTFVGNQIVTGFSDLAAQVVDGLEKIRRWLREGPVDASDSQINSWIQEVEEAITTYSRDGQVLTQVTELGTALGHVLAGFFIVLFATFFFLADGERIWSWVVRLAPRVARERVDSSGRVAWGSLTQFVRATVLVALADAIGIMLVAWFLGLPLILPIGVLVFLGAFVPMVGATIAGAVAVLVALVAEGPLDALLMLLGVIAVQQIEGHLLQPFLMGRFVSVHPLGVIVAIGCGVIVAGIAGALIAVPLVAVANAVAQHLARQPGAAGEDAASAPPAEDLQESASP